MNLSDNLRKNEKPEFLVLLFFLLFSCSSTEPEILIDGKSFSFPYAKWKSLANGTDKSFFLQQYIDFHLLFKRSIESLPDLYKQLKVADQLEQIEKNVSVGMEEVNNYYHPQYRQKVRGIDVRRISHILILCPLNAPPFEDEIARRQIDGIYERLLGGENFSRLAEQFSDDNTKTIGGDLGYFTSKMMVKPFAEASFRLGTIGETAIVRSEFGYHIIRLTGTNEHFRAEVRRNLILEKKRRIYDNTIEELRRTSNIIVNEKRLLDVRIE